MDGRIEVLAPAAARWPRAIADGLQTALALRDRAAGTVSSHGLAIATGQLLSRLLDLLSRARDDIPRCAASPNTCSELSALLTFLVIPSTDQVQHTLLAADIKRFLERPAAEGCLVSHRSTEATPSPRKSALYIRMGMMV